MCKWARKRGERDQKKVGRVAEAPPAGPSPIPTHVVLAQLLPQFLQCLWGGRDRGARKDDDALPPHGALAELEGQVGGAQGRDKVPRPTLGLEVVQAGQDLGLRLVVVRALVGLGGANQAAPTPRHPQQTHRVLRAGRQLGKGQLACCILLGLQALHVVGWWVKCERGVREGKRLSS